MFVDSVWFEGTFSKDNPSKAKFDLRHKLSDSFHTTTSIIFHAEWNTVNVFEERSVWKLVPVWNFGQIVQPSYFEANRDLEICRTCVMKPSTFTVSEVTRSDGCHHSLLLWKPDRSDCSRGLAVIGSQHRWDSISTYWKPNNTLF